MAKDSIRHILALLWVNCIFAASAELSLDEIDRASFSAASSPLQIEGGDMNAVRLQKSLIRQESRSVSLSGDWILAADQNGVPQWSDAIPATVPGSVHLALYKAGRIPDPLIGRNDTIAEKQSCKNWWLKKTFSYEGGWNNPLLSFAGIANRCKVWLNGCYLGQHEGMFGGPDFEVGSLLKKGRNELTVWLEAIPQTYLGGWPAVANEAWKHTVVINCVYGWHYAKIPSLGIWQDVILSEQPPAQIRNPFIITRSVSGKMRLVAQYMGLTQQAKVRVTVRPRNFKGEAQAFEAVIIPDTNYVALDFAIDNPALWWPNGTGEQPLYEAEIILFLRNRIADVKKTVFGIRTIEMRPLPQGASPEKYNWTFVINGRPLFVKGAGWCTADVMLDFSRRRYARILQLARDQHIQMLRAWGGGLPETDTFYDLCDELGIMVMQEWPTAWNSHETQPYDILHETVVRNTLRLRNHPSLVMWGAGNESDKPFGKAIDMMGRLSIELDGTRPFHRGEAWGGSRHDYKCWWDNLHLNHNLNMTADFWGEFGIPSLPDSESVQRYLAGEKYSWKPSAESIFAHHTPIFGTNGEIERLEQYAGYFMPLDSLRDIVLGSQLAQVVGVCHTLERARTMWPQTAGALYYKMNDNYPGLSWSCVDYYGAIKPLHYFARRSFAPVASVILFDRTNLSSQDVVLPQYLLDDNLALQGDTVEVRTTVYNEQMDIVADTAFRILSDGQVRRLPDLRLSSAQTSAMLLFFKTEIRDSCNTLLSRNWYFSNYETRPGIILQARPTSVEYIQSGRNIQLANTGDYPAVGVKIELPGKADSFTASDNYLWIDPGETLTVQVNTDDTVTLSGWNLKDK